MAAAQAETQLKELVPNFRRVRGTKLFRSSRPDRPTDGSSISLLGKVGIKLILDLRSHEEIPKETVLDAYYKRISDQHDKASHNASTNGDSVRSEKYLGQRMNIPILRANYRRCVFKKLPMIWQILALVLSVIDKLFGTMYSYKVVAMRVLNREGCAQQYVDIIRSSGQEIVKVLEPLGNPDNVPALICCAWGKDRTGITSALLQDLCGVDREIILEDYAKSEEVLEERDMNEEIVDHLKRYHLSARYAEAKREAMEAMYKVLLDEYGSAEQYLQLHGLTKENTEKIIENIKT